MGIAEINVHVGTEPEGMIAAAWAIVSRQDGLRAWASVMVVSV